MTFLTFLSDVLTCTASPDVVVTDFELTFWLRFVQGILRFVIFFWNGAIQGHQKSHKTLVRNRGRKKAVLKGIGDIYGPRSTVPDFFHNSEIYI